MATTVQYSLAVHPKYNMVMAWTRDGELYSFKGDPMIREKVEELGRIAGFAWSPEGNKCAFVNISQRGFGSFQVKKFSFDRGNRTYEDCVNESYSFTKPYHEISIDPTRIEWSPSGSFVAVFKENKCNGVSVYDMNGTRRGCDIYQSLHNSWCSMCMATWERGESKEGGKETLLTLSSFPRDPEITARMWVLSNSYGNPFKEVKHSPGGSGYEGAKFLESTGNAYHRLFTAHPGRQELKFVEVDDHARIISTLKTYEFKTKQIYNQWSRTWGKEETTFTLNTKFTENDGDLFVEHQVQFITDFADVLKPRNFSKDSGEIAHSCIAVAIDNRIRIYNLNFKVIDNGAGLRVPGGIAGMAWSPKRNQLVTISTDGNRVLFHDKHSVLNPPPNEDPKTAVDEALHIIWGIKNVHQRIKAWKAKEQRPDESLLATFASSLWTHFSVLQRQAELIESCERTTQALMEGVRRVTEMARGGPEAVARTGSAGQIVRAPQ